MSQNKLELFQTIQTNLAICRFRQNQTDSKLAFVRDHWKNFLQSILTIISLLVYLFHVTETVNEFMFSLFWLTVALCLFLAFICTVFKTSVLFEFLNTADTLFTQSE